MIRGNAAEGSTERARACDVGELVCRLGRAVPTRGRPVPLPPPPPPAYRLIRCHFHEQQPVSERPGSGEPSSELWSRLFLRGKCQCAARGAKAAPRRRGRMASVRMMFGKVTARLLGSAQPLHGALKTRCSPALLQRVSLPSASSLFNAV